MNTDCYDEICYYVGEIGEGPPVHRVPLTQGYEWFPHATTPAKKQVRQDPFTHTGSDNCMCGTCRYTQDAAVLLEEQQNWERRRLLQQALNAENREMAERAAKRQKLKDESIALRPLELD